MSMRILLYYFLLTVSSREIKLEYLELDQKLKKKKKIAVKCWHIIQKIECFKDDNYYLFFKSYSILVLVKIWETGSYSSDSSTVMKIFSNFAQSCIAYVHVFPHPFSWESLFMYLQGLYENCKYLSSTILSAAECLK